MKTLSILLLLVGSSIMLTAQTQNIPQVELKTPDGTNIMSSEIFDPATPTVVVFWKSGSNKCCDNLENMQTAWLEDLKQQGVKMVAICIGCNGAWSHVKPMANGKNWEFEIYIDKNGDFKRAMNITNAPCTMLYDQNQQLLCRHNGYCTGNEDLICEKILFSLENPEQYTEAK